MAMLETTGSVQELIRGNTAFALDLYHHLKKAHAGNVFFSPFSISSCLAMVSLGARANTAAQMARCLRFEGENADTHAGFAALQDGMLADNSRAKIDVRIANQLWPDKRLRLLPEFLDKLERYYRSGIQEIDFSNQERASQAMNDWVREATNALIPTIVDQEANRDALFVLANAIYFKGKWSAPFLKDTTEHDAFYVAPRQVIQVPMMSQLAAAWYSRKQGLQILEKWYGDGEFSMVILLPERFDGLESLETSLNLERLESLLASLQPVDEIRITLPKFRIASSYKLKDPLIEMGMSDAFSPKDADFSGMTGNRDLAVSEVIHKAVIEVEEEGTEAAAVTGTIMLGADVTDMRPLLVFCADHPFLFLIRHRPSQSILFLGRVVDPMRA
jgi:serpin B